MNLITDTNWHELSKTITLETRAFINGQFQPAISGRTFERTNPATGQKLADISACDLEDINLAVAAARAAFESGIWRDLHPTKRKAIMLEWARLIRENARDLALLETLDTGKPIKESLNVDAPSVANTIQWYAECIDKLYDQMAPNGASSLVMISREPVGVVGAVVPWNYPLIITGWKLGPALAAGNSVVLKPAEQSTLSALLLAKLAQQAGIPDGVLNVVPGLGHEAGKALGLHMDVDALVFTGSTEIGRKFLEYSAQSNIKKIGLELGGKSPHIVTRNCNLERAAMYVAYAIWYNQGESCNAGSRLLIERGLKEEFFALLKPWAEKMQPGDPLEPSTEMGALISQDHCAKVLEYIQLGVTEGANIVIGGAQVRHDSGGYFVPPTVLENVSNDMRIAREEIFGPILVTIEFDTLEQAVQIANDSEYGLAAAIWCDDVSQAHLVARKLRAGTVWINAFDHTSVNAPFGGYKQSGFGRDKGLQAFEEYTQVKTTWVELHAL